MNPPKQYNTKSVSESDYTVYLKKAKEFYQTMYQAEKSENWNAVGLNGVHCVISLIDTLLVRHVGIRSAADDHMAVVDLLTSRAAEKIKELAQKSQTARRVIAKKNLVEYDNRDFNINYSLDRLGRVQ